MYPFDILLYLWEIYSTSKEAEYSDVKMKIDKFFVSLLQRREFFARIKTDQVIVPGYFILTYESGLPQYIDQIKGCKYPNLYKYVFCNLRWVFKIEGSNLVLPKSQFGTF